MGGTPSSPGQGGTPIQSQQRGYPLGLILDGGTSCKQDGVPQFPIQTWDGVAPLPVWTWDGVPPIHTWDGVTPCPRPAPPPPPAYVDKLKILPSVIRWMRAVTMRRQRLKDSRHFIHQPSEILLKPIGGGGGFCAKFWRSSCSPFVRVGFLLPKQLFYGAKNSPVCIFA